MKDRVLKAQVKQVTSLVGRDYMYNSDICEQCGNEVDISELNILTGLCSTCRKSTKTKELLAKGLDCAD